MRSCRHTFPLLRFTLLASIAGFLLSAAVISLAAQNSAVDLGGVPADPLQAAPGKVVVLVFVRTDCPVSNRYAPVIQRMSAKYSGKAVFWLVYPDKTASAEDIRKHQHEYGYTLQALRDPQHALVKLSRVQVTPETAVFDASHRLIYHGRIDDLYRDLGRARTSPTTHELDDAIQAALSGKTPPANAAGVGCYISDLE